MVIIKDGVKELFILKKIIQEGIKCEISLKI